jgi:hypothetical protein
MPAFYQASGALTGAINVADPTPPNPAHQINDILICITANRVITNTCTTPSTWNLLFGPEDTTAWRSYVFWRRADSAAVTNPLCDWTATSADKYAQVHSIRGAIQTGSPFAASAFLDGTADPAVATGVTTTLPYQYVFSLGLDADDAATSATVTATDPAAWTVRHFTTVTTGADAGGFFYDGVRTTAGATGNVSHDFNAAPVAWGILVAAILEPPIPYLTVARHQ